MTQYVEPKVQFEQLDPRILPDMSVKVAFQSSGETKSENRSLIVPKAALRQSDGRDVVWIVRDGNAERRVVTVGFVMGDEATIGAGVNSGERVVVISVGTLLGSVNRSIGLGSCRSLREQSGRSRQAEYKASETRKIHGPNKAFPGSRSYLNSV